MKRKSKRILLLVLLTMLFACCMGACRESDTPNSHKEEQSFEIVVETVLAVPKGLRADFWNIKWNEVENASGYCVKVGDLEFETEENELDLIEVLKPGSQYVIYVKARGDGERYKDSNYAQILFEKAVTTKNLKYTLLEDGTYEVGLSNRNFEEEVVLPDTYKGKPVTSIARSGFNPPTMYPTPNSVTKRVRLPWGLKSVQQAAFQSCRVLEEAQLPAGVEYIGWYGFSGCQLKEVHLPAGITKIEDYSFNSNDFTEITIPEGVTYIGREAFSYCKLLTEIRIPECVTYIGGSAFLGCKCLSEISLPKGETYIGGRAFEDTAWVAKQPDGPICVKGVLLIYKHTGEEAFTVKDMQLPPDVTAIGEDAFRPCKGLTEIIIPEGITKIDERAFLSLENLRMVTLPNSLRIIARSAFENCKSLQEITLPEGLESVESAFYRCDSLTSVTIPAGVKLEGAFNRCLNLKDVTFESGIKVISNGIFFRCPAITEIQIPDGVETIEFNAFACSGLTEVILPKSLTSIGNGAFASCTSLTSIIFEGTVEEWNAIEKVDNWNMNVPATKVVCCDGEVAL